MSKSGTEIGNLLLGKQGFQREAIILEEIRNNNVPNWLVDFVPVSITENINGIPRELTIYVSRDVVSLGNDTDFLRIPTLPITSQVIADRYHSILPSRKLSNDIYNSATAKLAPKPLSNSRESTKSFIDSNNLINNQLSPELVKSALVAGDKKDIVIGPNLDGSKVAIYGWHQTDGKPIQPYSTIHDSSYSDYSHGTRLISKFAYLDRTIPVDLTTIFIDDNLHKLVSDQGPFIPRFPNKFPLSPKEIEKFEEGSKEPSGKPFSTAQLLVGGIAIGMFLHIIR